MSDSAILAGAAFDKEGNNYKITYQIMDPKKLKKNAPEAGVFISTTAPTIHEAFIRHIKGLKRRVFFSHTRAVIISSELARKEGILPVLDMANRDQQFRLNSYIYIADHPSQILGLPSPLDPMSAFGLSKGTESVHKDVSEMSAISLRELMMISLAPGDSEYVTYLREHKEQQPAKSHVDISGPAVIKQGKLVKIIKSPLVTRGILWFTNRVHKGSMSLHIPDDPTTMAAIELHKSSTEIKPRLEDGKLAFDVDVKISCDINEWQSAKPLTSAKIKSLEKEIGREITREMTAALKRMREEPITDILNLGLEVYRQHPNYWHQIQEDWDEIFRDVDVRIHAEGTIQNVGMVKDRKPDPPRANLLPWSD